MLIKLNVNGTAREVDVPPMKRLLDTLREDLGLTGTKEGCGEGECGACSVQVDDLVVNSCLIPTGQLHGAQIVTAEGLADEGKMTPLQEAFVQMGGVQCGICTPGMLMAADALLKRVERPSRLQIRHAISGNLCRCTGYQRIVDSIEKAAEQNAGGAK